MFLISQGLCGLTSIIEESMNEFVKLDGFHMPRIKDCLDEVSGSTLLSTFDLSSGYYKIHFKENDIKKSAFVCIMSFGLN